MIRAARESDAADVAALWNWMIRDTLATFTTVEKTTDDVISLVHARPDAFFVADRSDELAGFITFGPFRAGPGYAATCEHSVIVDPGAQGRGLGRALIAEAEAAARAGGMHAMIGGLSGANPDAMRFHLACGFAECGRLREVGRKNGQWLDLIFVQKILAPVG